MSLNDAHSTSCPNCGRTIPAGAPVCPNCGWDTRQSGVWPPGIPHDAPPTVQRKNVLLLGLQLVGGTLVGTLLTFFATVLFLLGPIACIALHLELRKKIPYFAGGVLTGMFIGLVGVGACFYSIWKL